MGMHSKQCVAIDFCVRLGKDINETCTLMHVTYGEECFADRTIWYWHKSFRDGWIETCELLWNGRPRLSLTEVSINTVTAAIEKDRHYSVRELEDLLHIPKTTINQILRDLQMGRLYIMGIVFLDKRTTTAAYWLLHQKSWNYCRGLRLLELSNNCRWKLNSLPGSPLQTQKRTFEM